MLTGLLARYAGKVRQERLARLEGDVIAADFYLRQLTHVEMIFEVGGAGMVLMHMVWSGIEPDGQPLAGGPISMRARFRRRSTGSAARPGMTPCPTARSSCFRGRCRTARR